MYLRVVVTEGLERGEVALSLLKLLMTYYTCNNTEYFGHASQVEGAKLSAVRLRETLVHTGPHSFVGCPLKWA